MLFSFVLIAEFDFTSSVDALSSQKEKTDKLVEQLQQEIEACNSEIAAMKEDQANREDEKQLLLNEVQQLSEAVEIFKEKDLNVARLEEELVFLNDEKVKLNQQLVSAEEELMLLRQVKEHLPAEEVSSASTLGPSTDAATGALTSDVVLKPDISTRLEEAIPTVEESIPLGLEPSSVETPVNTVSGEELQKVQNEMSEIQEELARMKALNEKLKAKLRAQVKKEKAKSESLGEGDSSEIKADFEKARQEKLNLEKSAYEMREELDEVVRRKDGAIADLKAKIQQLSDEKSRGAALVEKYEKLVAEREDEINKVAEKANVEIQGLRDRYQRLLEERGILVKAIEQEKLEYVQELENTKDSYETILVNKETEVENFKRALDNAKTENEKLQFMLQEAQQSLKELTKLKGNFDHIVSGLREDLQQALDDKAAADQIAHEFRVQLKRTESLPEQVASEKRDVTVRTEDVDRTQLEAKLHDTREEAASLRETLVVVTKEKEDLEERLRIPVQKSREGTEERNFMEEETSSKGGDSTMEGELPTVSEDLQEQETPSDVVWLQKELKKASELNRKLKIALKKKRERPRSDSKEDGSSNETRTELERIRAAKVDSDRQVIELRLELDNFVKDKEKLVASLKSKMEQVLQEKERASSLIEQHEKLLLEKDSAVYDLTEQLESLSSENEALKSSLEELTAIKSQLRLAVEANVELENYNQYNQSVLDKSTERISELELELENAKETYLNEIRDLKQEHGNLLSVNQREAEEAILELRKINTDLQQNIQAIADEKGGMERELLATKTELQQVVQNSYPVIEEKDHKINQLVTLMEAKQMEADETIAQLETSESKLQEQIQLLDTDRAELKKQLEEMRSELEEKTQEFQRYMDDKDKEQREEKESHQKRMQEFEDKFQEHISQSQVSTDKLQEELSQAKVAIDSLAAQLHTAEQEKQNFNRLHRNFDHILSGLREDLQRALDGKAAADEIAHELQVQLEDVRKSMPGAPGENDDSPMLEQNKISEMLEAAQHEVVDVRSALEVTLKERDELQVKIKELELLYGEKNEKEVVSSGKDDLIDVGKDNTEKVVREVILQTSVDNELSAPVPSEAEFELENLRNEMQKMKSLNDKLKTKLRASLKKKRVKSDSGDEDTSIRDELQTELEKIRQEKLESEKNCQELRVELDAFVRQKENIVNELKSKIDQLVTENEKTNGFVQYLEEQIEQKDGQLQDFMNDVRALESDNDQAWKNVEDLRRENANLCGEIEDAIFQRNESEKECSRRKLEQERLVEEYDSLLDKKEKTIANLENQLEDTAEKYKTEVSATRDQYEGLIFQIQSHADSLERERLSASKEAGQLKGQLLELNEEKEDINKLKVNFDHIVSSLREDLQHALEGKAAADQIAHEFQVQLKRLEKVSGKLRAQYNDKSVGTSGIEDKQVKLQEELQATQNEADKLRVTVEAVNRDKQDLENKVKSLEALLQEREMSEVKVRKDEKDGEQEKIFSESLVQSPESMLVSVVENETLSSTPPQQLSSSDSVSDFEDIRKVKDDFARVQEELEKVKAVNERLKTKLKAVIRKTKEVKSEAGAEFSGQELRAELNKTRQEKLESEKAAQQLRVELDELVREKEGIVSELKTRVQQIRTEKEEINSMLEQNEKILLEKDAEVHSLAEQFHSLSEEHDKFRQTLNKIDAENQELKTLLEQLQLEKVKAERELQAATAELKRLLEGDRPLLEEKTQKIASLGAELSSQKELFLAEIGSLKDRYENVISEQSNHANNVEKALVSANTEVEQLKLRLGTLEQGREDIDKLRTEFDHIVSGLSEDLHRALEGKAAADEIAYEFQMKLKRLEKSSVLSELRVEDVCVGTEELEPHLMSGKEDMEELQTRLDHLKKEKEELEARVTGLDEVVQDREGNFFD